MAALILILVRLALANANSVAPLQNCRIVTANCTKIRKESENDIQIKLCLAWSRPTDDDPISEFLKPIEDQSLPFSTAAFVFDGNLFWPEGELPPQTWRKFNSAIKSELINREDFLSFCNELTILLEMPKASLDLKNPGGIENVIIRQAEKLGVTTDRKSVV